MKKVIGWTMVSGPLAALFVADVAKQGLYSACVALGGALLFAALIGVGAYLMTHD